MKSRGIALDAATPLFYTPLMIQALRTPRHPLLRSITTTLLWIAAFAYACSLFLCLKLLLQWVPPTPPIAIGRVTVDGASKLRDYLTAGLFYALVPVATIAFLLLFRRLLRREDLRRTVSSTFDGSAMTSVILFSIPFFLAPFFYLTTKKEGWGLALPMALALAGPAAISYIDSHRWIRSLFQPSLRPFHALIATEGFSWLIFRYLATGRRIAHIPTLFLEVIFVVFFLLLFWVSVAGMAKLSNLLFGLATEITFRRFALSGIPLLALPLLGLFLISEKAIILTALASMVAAFLALRSRDRIDGRQVFRFLGLIGIPLILFCVSYASTAQMSQWIDLFHRGESLGPASDYLRGKIPYRDVFILHGLLEDGLLDSWLMRLFGRSAEVAMTRAVMVSSLTIPALWILGFVVFDSLSLAALVAMLGFTTFVDNQRALLEIVVVTLLLVAIKHSRLRRRAIVLAGIVAAIALFFSLEIGIYCIVAGIASLAVSAWIHRSTQPRPAVGVIDYLAGLAIGATPFVLYLLANGVLGTFFSISFLSIPSIIDVTWSLPFPDLTSMFHGELTLRNLSDLLLSEKIGFLLNPAVIAVSLVYLLSRLRRHDWTVLDDVLLVITMFALITQRSALGRADFAHQYFSAFLTLPILVILGVLLARSLRPAWSSGDGGTQAFLGFALVVTIPLVITSFWVPDLVNVRLDSMVRYRPRISRVGYTDPAGEAVRLRIAAVREVIERTTGPGEPIFDFSNQPALYFFVDRPNPTRFYQVPILSPLAFQLEAIRDLERARPRVVLRKSPENYDIFDGIENDRRAPALAAYLDDHYSFWRKIRGVELWERDANVARRSPESYAREQRMPRATSLAPRIRSIFPSVGSLAGANSSFWRSDLIVHNPYPEFLRLRVRYVTPALSVDRNLTVPPGEVFRFVDVVARYLGAPGTRGLLWIEYRADRPPIMKLRSYDSARPGQQSIDSPLSFADAAHAGSERNELTIIGANDIDNRRVNIGVINIGDVPVRFKITNTTHFGAIIGEPIEGAVDEDDSYLLADAGPALGVPIDETITTHIRILEGTAIAYASVIDPDTGDHAVLPGVATKAVEH